MQQFAQYKFWSGYFKKGRISIESDKNPGCFSTNRNDELVSHLSGKYSVNATKWNVLASTLWWQFHLLCENTGNIQKNTKALLDASKVDDL